MAHVGTVFQGYSGLNSKAFDSDWRYAVVRIQLWTNFIIKEMHVMAVLRLLKDFPGYYAWFKKKEIFLLVEHIFWIFPTKSPCKAPPPPPRTVICNL
jgi:hypothetical protein